MTSRHGGLLLEQVHCRGKALKYGVLIAIRGNDQLRALIFCLATMQK